MRELSIVKFPPASVFVEATASMPPCSCSKITSAPATALFVVLLVTLPDTVAENTGEVNAMNAIKTTPASSNLRGRGNFHLEHPLMTWAEFIVIYFCGLSDMACRVAAVGAPPVNLSISAITRAASTSSARFISS